jgi:hypothetical protein
MLLIEKIKQYKVEIVLTGTIFLISIISFNLGKIKALKDFKEPIKIYDNGGDQSNIDFQVVASVNSNKYHFPWCSGAGNIKDSNKIVFVNEAAAMAAGYILAGNCNK